ncbi:MAG TPA: hypothetical protein VFQ82_03860 [Stellaceae bacterium]|jgi:hypothetical protein|nr:hypothetical protein [Stellaceae bacterium]
MTCISYSRKGGSLFLAPPASPPDRGAAPERLSPRASTIVIGAASLLSWAVVALIVYWVVAAFG